MNSTQVFQLLASNKNERGQAHWARLASKSENLRSHGIGLTVLRKLAKQIGRDHDLALELWASDFYDARVIALLIDEPAKITIDQAEQQVEEVDRGELVHVFSSCDASLAKTPIAKELSDDWMSSDDPVRRRCSYGLLYEISKSKKKSAPDTAYFLGRIEHIRQHIVDEDRLVRLSMGGALMGMGKRNAQLNQAALAVARFVGPIDFGTAENKCEPFNVAKHLTSDYIKKKLGV